MNSSEADMNSGARTLESLSPKAFPPLLFPEILPRLESWTFVPEQGIEDQTSQQ